MAKLQVEIASTQAAWRGKSAFVRRILTAAAAAEHSDGAVSVLLADDEALRDLNARWRGKDQPTNVLSFPAADQSQSLGDLALSAETIRREAKEQGKTEEAHCAHLLVHGFLHLLGHDHEDDREAEIMENRERAILAELGYADPYLVKADAQ